MFWGKNHDGGASFASMFRRCARRFAYDLIRIIYLCVAANRVIQYGLSIEVLDLRELRMQETAVNLIGLIARTGECTDGRIAKLQTGAKRQFGRVTGNLFSGRPVFNELVVVSLVVVIILRTGG